MKPTTLIIAVQGMLAMDIIALRSYAGKPLAILWAALALVAGTLMLALIRADIGD